MPPNTVYVGRPTKWGNPSGSVETYTAYIQAIMEMNPEHWNLDELRGKNLACWCPLDKPCHADILLEIADTY